MIALLVLLVASLAAPPAGAQDQAAPGEPDIVLPEVILRIEDFSVESLSGAAPGEEDTLPPARELPLPAGQEPLLAEPPAPPAEGPDGQPAPARSLSAMAELGAGTSNHLFSQVTLNSLGAEPRFSLRFLHETLDGVLGVEDPGSGFDYRKEELEGALKLRLGRKASLELEGSLHEGERGLQGQPGPAAISRLLRTGGLGAELAWPFSEHWTLSAALNGSFATELLTVQTGQASGLDELRGSPRLSLEVRTERFWLAVDGRYAFEVYEGQEAHRAGALARFGVEVSKSARLEGSAGWHWSQLSSPEHLVPFDLTLTLTPGSSLSIAASGGYRVEELELRELAEAHPWAAFPDPLTDDHGWFADFSATYSLQRSFSLTAGAHLSLPREDIWSDTAALDPSGLYQLVQREATRVALEASLRWTPARDSYLAAEWRMEMAQYPEFTPAQQIRLEGGLGSDKWGVNGTVLFKTGYPPSTRNYTLTPELSLGGFFQPGEAVRLTAELQDLLSPLSQGGQRLDWGWDPFLSPGIRGTFKVQINL
jgi:hypothetical protein